MRYRFLSHMRFPVGLKVTMSRDGDRIQAQGFWLRQMAGTGIVSLVCRLPRFMQFAAAQMQFEFYRFQLGATCNAARSHTYGPERARLGRSSVRLHKRDRNGRPRRRHARTSNAEGCGQPPEVPYASQGAETLTSLPMAAPEDGRSPQQGRRAATTTSSATTRMDLVAEISLLLRIFFQ
jgi:hypothetical protein